MTLLDRCAQLCAEGQTRDEIAATLMLSREVIDWLFDSDSFDVLLERYGASREGS